MSTSSPRLTQGRLEERFCWALPRSSHVVHFPSVSRFPLPSALQRKDSGVPIMLPIVRHRKLKNRPPKIQVLPKDRIRLILRLIFPVRVWLTGVAATAVNVCSR